MDFIIDYAAFRYDNRDNNIIMPKHPIISIKQSLVGKLRGKDSGSKEITFKERD